MPRNMELLSMAYMQPLVALLLHCKASRDACHIAVQAAACIAHPDAGERALVNGVPDLGPWGILQGSHAQEDAVALYAGVVARLRELRMLCMMRPIVRIQRPQLALHAQ